MGGAPTNHMSFGAASRLKASVRQHIIASRSAMTTAQIRESLVAADNYINAQSALLDAVRLGEAMTALADNITTQISNLHGDVSELTDLLGDINQSSFSATHQAQLAMAVNARMSSLTSVGALSTGHPSQSCLGIGQYTNVLRAPPNTLPPQRYHPHRHLPQSRPVFPSSPPCRHRYFGFRLQADCSTLSR